jgi:hypothetical protein
MLRYVMLFYVMFLTKSNWFEKVPIYVGERILWLKIYFWVRFTVLLTLTLVRCSKNWRRKSFRKMYVSILSYGGRSRIDISFRNTYYIYFQRIEAIRLFNLI